MEDRENLDLISDQERRKTNRNGIIALLLTAVIIMMFFLGYYVRGITEPVSGQKINEIMQLIKDKSVWAGDMSEDELAEMLVKNLLSDDKYAKYYSPEEYKRMLEQDNGTYKGIGVALDKSANVVQVNMNSPAYRAGIKVGDAFVAGVYKKDVAAEGDKKFTVFSEKLQELKTDNSYEKTIADVCGEFFAEFDFGEEFDIKIRRDETDIPFKLKKDNYTAAYVEYYDSDNYMYFSTEKEIVQENGEPVEKEIFGARIKEGDGNIELSDDTAYIKLHAFEGTAANQFIEALDYMKQRGKTKLILDLRDNGGGLITVLTEIASCLINDNGSSRIKIMKAQEKLSATYYYTSSNKFYNNIKDISVIANGKTASAAEALIGALNDYGYTETFGGAHFGLDNLVLTEYNVERKVYCTYGKGIMQTTYELKSGGALMLTTAYVYWPLLGLCIHDVGIETSKIENCVSDENAIKRANEILHRVNEEVQD